MALLFVDGFEARDYAIKYIAYTGGNAPTLSSAVTRYGGNSLSVYHNNGYTTFTRNIPATSKVITGIAYLPPLATTFLYFFGDSAVTAHLNVAVTANGTVQLKRGATVLASSAASAMPIGVWSYIEASATIHDTTGFFEVKVNGVTAATFNGDTKNGGTNNSIDAVQIYLTGFNYTHYIDDFYICDDTGAAPQNTYLGEIRIHALVPDGAGSLTQMTPSTGANYAAVDDLPYSATDYIRGSSGQTDLYTATNLPAGTGTIFGVQANAIAKKTDAGNLSGRTKIKSGATTVNGTTTALISSDIVLTDVRALNPDTSAAWTSGDINSLEIGVEAV